MSETDNSTSQAPRVAVIGGGVMGSTLLTALQVGGWPQDCIIVAERDADRANALAATHGIEVTGDPAVAVKDAEVIIIAVKPQDAEATLAAIKPAFTPHALVVSVAAGLSAAFFEKHLGADTVVVRAMPNTPAIVAHGATAIAAGTNANDAHLAIVGEILRATGLVVTVTEEEIDAVIAVSGSGPAYFFALVEALTEAGVAQGLDRDVATALATQTFVGAARLLQESGDTPQVLRKRVSSKGGTTLAALEAMANAGLQDVVSAGARAAAHRAKEMGEELGNP